MQKPFVGKLQNEPFASEEVDTAVECPEEFLENSLRTTWCALTSPLLHVLQCHAAIGTMLVTACLHMAAKCALCKPPALPSMSNKSDDHNISA